MLSCRQLAAQSPAVRIALVSGESQTEVSELFAPFTRYLETSIPGTRFEIARMASIEDLIRSAEQGRVEFAFCSASAMVELNVRLGARAVATQLQPSPEGNGTGHGSPLAGGAVFVRKSRTDIRSLRDVKGKRVLALSAMAVGGWLAPLYEMRQVGLDEKKDFASLQFLFSYQGIAKQVCAGKVDVGVLSGPALGRVHDTCPEGFRVLPGPGGVTTVGGYPVSTRPYAETALAAMANVDPELASRLVVALLTIPPDSETARAVNSAGFSIPQSYAPVQQMMEELRVPPFESYGYLTLTQEMALHVREISGVLGAFALILFAAWLRAHRLYRDLKTSESVRHRVFERSHIAQGVVDPEGWTIVDCNAAAVRLYGWASRDDLKGKNILVVSAPTQADGTPSVELAARQLAEAGNAKEMAFEWRHQRPDGTVWDGEIRVLGFRANGKRLIQYTLQDVTASRALERRVQLLARALHSVKECISIGDAEDRIVYVNEAFLATYGYSEAELLGKTALMMDSPRNPPGTRKEILPATLAGGWRGELWNRTKSGRDILVDLSTAIVYDENKRVLATIGSARDITEYRNLQEQYLQAQKMEGIGRLAGGIAHDFNNLLTVINGYCALILQKVQPSDPHWRNLRAIQDAGNRAADLTKQLLTFSKRQPPPLRPLALSRLLEGEGEFLRRLVGEAIRLDIEARQGEVWMVMADESQVHQVLMNLTVNAKQAMPEGGWLKIGTENIELDGHSGSLPPGQYVLLSVSDTGHGMDEETKSHIFEPFFTTKGEDGTGLGLATVYGIVRQSGGEVSVSSKIDVGTTFRIYFPRTVEVESSVTL